VIRVVKENRRQDVLRPFLIYFEDWFRGAGAQAVVLVGAESKIDAIKRFAVQYLGWDENEPELKDKIALEKYFFAGEVHTVVLPLDELVNKSRKRLQVIFEEKIPGDESVLGDAEE
jgi:hypothetical protein